MRVIRSPEQQNAPSAGANFPNDLYPISEYLSDVGAGRHHGRLALALAALVP
jgi:hypothetical protein